MAILILISIIIISLLILYKIIAFLWNLNKRENYSAIDILFIFIFCCLLVVPMSHMDKREDSALENRTLAKKPIFIKDNQLNLDFGKDFNSWFNDRINTRKDLIKTNVRLRCILNFTNFAIAEI